MKLGRSLIGLPLFSVLALATMAGCKPGETTPSATEDPLTGQWNNTSCYGSTTKPADVESCKTTLDFDKDLDLEITAQSVTPAAAEKLPGCVTTKRITGLEWSTNQTTETLKISGAPQATEERTGCVDEKDNQQPTPTKDTTAAEGDAKYAIHGDTLTIESGRLRGTYKR